MLKILLRIAIGLVLGCAATWLFWRFFEGPVALVIAAPLFGVLLARPIIDLVAESSYAGKAAALSGLHGRYFSHRGIRIDIAQDDDAGRWVLASGVRKVVPGLPRDEVLVKQFGERTGTVEGFEGFRIRADALAEYLQKSTDTSSLKFREWLDRTVRGGSLNPRAGARGAHQSNSKV